MPIATVLLLMAMPVAAQTPISLDTPVTGTIATTGEEDWYSLTTAVIGDLTVTQTAWPPYIDTRFAVYGPDSQALGQTHPVYAAAPGIYYIKIWSANNGTSTDVYTFHVSLAQATTGNDIDSGGNNPAAAIPLTLGVAVSDTIAPSKETAGAQDVDWYSVTTTVVGDLTFARTVYPPYIDTRISVFGPDSSTLAQGSTVYAAAPGTYYFQVWSANDGSSILPYDLTVTLTAATTGNDIDQGANSATGAVATTIGATVTDTIAPSKETALTQDVDWFTVPIATVGDFTVTQNAWPPYIDTRISVFGPNDSTLAQSTTNYAAAPGTYYLKVWSANDGSSITPYAFTTTVVEATTGNDIDQGANSSAGAITINSGTPVTDTIAPCVATALVQDVDWFRFTTTGTADITVTQTAWPPYIETRIAVYGPNSDSTPLVNPAAPGTYYVKVWSANDGCSIAPYVFTATFVGSPATDAGAADAGQVDSATVADHVTVADHATASDHMTATDRATATDRYTPVDGGAPHDGGSHASDGAAGTDSEPDSACGGCSGTGPISTGGHGALIALACLALVGRRWRRR